MKNYVVKALTNFDDYQGLEINSDNPKVRRNTKDVFNVTKERYEHLKELNLVVLVGIDKAEVKKTTKKKK
ncbi:MAG: hypothetical protein IJH63_13070 [Methanobrevibacter sp.]|nr:hypothetical protein [Bacilli bacterium]MBQ3415573.1 hypothetical protein [Clostridia bacterium]MBQ6630690.1 hypothetical protein [Romboutsia sp.]MBR0058166.1 hypothetical protein [Methanobrevibacter sp.]MBR0371622.1 hypothetical protein [Methanobrevibacter sp.]